MSGEQQQPTVQLAELWERTSSRGKPIHERIPLILSLSLLCDGAERRTFAPPRNGTVAGYRAEGKRHIPK